jgi:aminoglycoside phosphotransferase (APT) family kinase protein
MRPDHPDPAAIDTLTRRILPGVPLSIERVTAGVSTFVYRVRSEQETFYLRVLPERNASFAPEVWVHQTLRASGADVPEVVHFEHRSPILDRSVMLVREIPGDEVGHRPVGSVTRGVLIEAGRQLAVINSVTVDGFGWIRRDQPEVGRLQAEHAAYRTFLLEHLEGDLASLVGSVLTEAEVAAIRTAVGYHEDWLDVPGAHLAHGDFDATAIFRRDGRFTGIIDFGEMRGTDRWYDLGHFRMHDGETYPAPLLDWLVEGYRLAAQLADNYAQRISFASLLIGVRTLGWHIEKQRHGLAHRQAAAVRRDLATLRG